MEKKPELTVRKTPRPLMWLLYLYIVSLPFYGFSFFNLGERALARPDWVASGLLIGLFILYLGIDRVRLRHGPANIAVVMSVFVGLFNMVNLFDATSGQFIDFGTKAAQLLLVTATFFVISSLNIDEREFKVVLRVWFVMAFLTAIYAVYQLFARTYGWSFAYLGLNNPTVAGERGMTGRLIFGYAQVSGFLREPSFLGAYLLPPLILSSIFILRGQGSVFFFRLDLLNWALVATLLLAILLSNSLGAYLSLVAIGAIVYTSGRIKRAKFTKLVILFLVLLLCGGLLLNVIGIPFLSSSLYRVKYLWLNIQDPAGSPQITSFYYRQERALAALRVWLSHPVLGVGLGGFSYYSDLDVINNGWLQLLVHQGLLGFTVVLLILGGLLWRLNRLSKSLKPTTAEYSLVISFFFILISDMINTIFTFNWTHTMRWFTLALANLVYLQVRAKLVRVVGQDPVQAHEESLAGVAGS